MYVGYSSAAYQSGAWIATLASRPVVNATFTFTETCKSLHHIKAAGHEREDINIKINFIQRQITSKIMFKL
jgi:hypothetical protein